MYGGGPKKANLLVMWSGRVSVKETDISVPGLASFLLGNSSNLYASVSSFHKKKKNGPKEKNDLKLQGFWDTN